MNCQMPELVGADLKFSAYGRVQTTFALTILRVCPACSVRLHWSTVVVFVTISVSITMAVSMMVMTAPCPVVTPPSGEYAVGASPGCADVVVRSVVMIAGACVVVGCCDAGSSEVASEDDVDDVVDVACASDRVA
jgi:hypothetical protein